jgi:hypothetical protein
MFIIAQAIATTRTKITSQNLIGIRASLRRVTSTALGLPVSARISPAATNSTAPTITTIMPEAAKTIKS